MARGIGFRYLNNRQFLVVDVYTTADKLAFFAYMTDCISINHYVFYYMPERPKGQRFVILGRCAMNRWRRASELANLIVEFGKDEISRDQAELAAYRYYSKRSFWDMIKPNHTSLSQIANNYVISERIARNANLA